MTAQIALHELRVLMRSPFAWMAAGLLQLLFGWLFLSAVERYIEQQTATAHVISQTVSQAAASAGLSSYLIVHFLACLLYTSPSPRDATLSRMPSSA